MLPALFAGCANYEIRPMAARDMEGWANGVPPQSEGYIIYQPELYFSATVTTDGDKEDVTVTPIYLPNYQKPYRVTTRNFLAKADFGFEFENGWKLTKLSNKADNSTLANTLAGELKTILSAGGLPAAQAGGVKKRAILFRPAVDPATGYFTGFTRVGIFEADGTK